MFVYKMTTKPEPAHLNLRYRGDYIGMRFGSLTVIGYPISRKGIRCGGAYCICDCGEPTYVSTMYQLFSGAKTQCAKCGRKQAAKAVSKWRADNPTFKRGIYFNVRNERLFKVWTSMNRRCGHACGYEDVEVCSEWKDYFAFKDWAYSHGYDENAPRGKCTIDRINPFGNYEPSNCRFVDMKTQARNKRKDWANLDEETQKMLLETALNN